MLAQLHVIDAQSCSAGQQYGDYVTYILNADKYFPYNDGQWMTGLPNAPTDLASTVEICKDYCTAIRTNTVATEFPTIYYAPGNCYGFHVATGSAGYEYYCYIGYSSTTLYSTFYYDAYMASTVTGCHPCPVGTYKGSGSGLCAACPAGKSTTITGATIFPS